MNTPFAYEVLRCLHNCINAIAAHDAEDTSSYEEHMEWALEAYERAEEILAHEAQQQTQNSHNVKLLIAAHQKIRKDRE